MEKVILLSLACAAISFTITWTSIFEKVREYLSKVHPKVEELMHCPWCFNHYVVLVALIFGAIDSKGWLGFLINWFSVVCIGGIIHYILLRAYKPVAEAAARRTLEKLYIKPILDETRKSTETSE